MGEFRKKSFKCFSSTTSSTDMSTLPQQSFFVSDSISDSASDCISEKQFDDDAILPSRPSVSTAGRSSSGNDSRCLLSFKAHSGGICALAMSKTALYTGSEDGLLVAFRLADLKEMDRFGGSGNGTVKAIVLGGESLVLSAHQDHKIRAWKQSNHRLQATLPCVRDSVSSAFLNRSTAYVKVRRHHKCLWNQHFDTISCLAVDAANGVLYSGSWDRTIKVWRLRDVRCVQSVEAHTDAVNTLAVAAGGLLISGSADSSIKVWVNYSLLGRNGVQGKKQKVADLRLVEELEQPAPVNCVAVSDPGGWVYVGCSDGRITVWMIVVEVDEPTQDGDEVEVGASRSGRRVYCEGFGLLPGGHSMAVLSVAATGDVVCSGSGDRSVRVWRRGEHGGEHVCVAVLMEMHSRCAVKSVMVSVDVVDGCIVYSGGLDGFVKVWWVSLVSSGGCGSGKGRLMESPCSVLDYRA